MTIFDAAEREIAILEEELDKTSDPEEQLRIRRAIRDVELEAAEEERLREKGGGFHGWF